MATGSSITVTIPALSEADVAYVRDAMRAAVGEVLRSKVQASPNSGLVKLFRETLLSSPSAAAQMSAADPDKPVHPVDAIEDDVAAWLDRAHAMSAAAGVDAQFAWAVMLRQLSLRGLTQEKADRVMRGVRSWVRR